MITFAISFLQAAQGLKNGKENGSYFGAYCRAKGYAHTFGCFGVLPDNCGLLVMTVNISYQNRIVEELGGPSKSSRPQQVIQSPDLFVINLFTKSPTDAPG